MSTTDRNVAYRQQAREWLSEHAPSYSGSVRDGLSVEDDLALGKRWQRLKAESGFAAITLPQEYGGAGGTEVEKAIFSEEEMRFDLPTAYFSISLGMPIPIMARYANDEQRNRHIPPAIRGEEIWCQLFSEPAAGSDLAALRLAARRDGDGWRLNGQKLWTSWAQFSDFGVVVARTDPSVPKHAGLTYFYVDMKSTGISVRPVKLLSGNEDVNEVFFDEVYISDNQRLGDVGGGFRVAIDTLMIERYAVTDPAGYGPPLSALIDLARQVGDGDKAAIDDGQVRDEIARAYCEQQGLRIIHDRAVAALARGGEPGPEGAVRKLLSAASRQRIGALALDLAGVEGVSWSEGDAIRSHFSASWLDSPTLRIAGGTDEILRNTIAEHILKLPQDYRPDKGKPFN